MFDSTMTVMAVAVIKQQPFIECFVNLFIWLYSCARSSVLQAGLLQWWLVGATLVAVHGLLLLRLPWLQSTGSSARAR